MASSIFQLVTGLANASQWYPWSFSFRSTHYAVAWIAIGSLLVHVAVKLPVIRAAYAEPLPEPTSNDRPRQPGTGRAAGRTGPAAAPSCGPRSSPRAWRVLAAAGNTVPWLRRVSVFAIRSGEGPQGVPINRSAAAARVDATAAGPAFRLDASCTAPVR